MPNRNFLRGCSRSSTSKIGTKMCNIGCDHWGLTSVNREGVGASYQRIDKCPQR